ncbi:Glutamate receptor, partial [Folsomia candida]
EQALRGKGYVREGPNGTLTGMAAQINKDLADISISSTEFLEYRITGPDGFSYLLPTFKLGMEAYFKQPPASSIRDVFTSGFSLELWVTMLALWIFICLSMHLACLIYFKEDWFKCLDWSDVVMSDEISIWATGAMCQQGWYFTPKCTGTRIIFFFGWFTGFFCYIAYSAQLVSILSVEVVPIKSWDDLIRDEFFIYNDNHIPTTKYFVKGLQQRGIIPTVPEEMRNVDIEKTFEQMIKSKSAMVSISDSLFPILQTMGLSENYICSVLSDVRIGSRTVIMSIILQMLERGVNNRILRDYFVTTSVQCLTGGSGFNKPLGGKDVFTAYAILLSGFILSCAILVAEQLFRRMWNSTKLLPNPEPLAAAPLASIMQYNTNGETTSHTNIINYYLNRRKSSNISKNDIKRWAQARF